MVIADYNIICIGQKQATIFGNDKYYVETNKVPMKSKPVVYGNTHYFAQYQKGIWYSFGPKEREDGSYTDEEWFDLNYNSKYLYNVAVIEKHRDTVIEILNKCISVSPSGYVGVIFRLELKRKECIKGVIIQSQFEKLLLNNKIKYNYLYIVGNEEQKKLKI